jgi:putative redox protein
MMHPISHANVRSTGIDYRHEITSGSHILVTDEPVSGGGQDAGPAPYDLLLAALGSCTAITLRMYAARKGWDLGALEVQLTFLKNKEGEESIERVLRSSASLSEEQWTRLIEIAGRTPVTKTIMAGTSIKTERGT